MRQPLQLAAREAESAALLDALREHRLVTVWGPTGAGKSALVRHVLAGRALCCSLAACRVERDVLRALADGLGLALVGKTLTAAVARALGRTDRAVILDGADEAAGPLRHWLPTWLATGPEVRFVVTARCRLGLDEERSFELALPSIEQALVIWRDATERVDHISSPVAAAEIVERLDRLPLALEWWAPRAALLGDAACLERLRRQVDQDDPLAVAADESIGGLTDADRDALARIAMFEQGLPTVALDRAQVGLESLEQLSRRALVRTAHGIAALPRVIAYRTVRQRIRAWAREAGRWDELAGAHATVVCELAELSTAEPTSHRSILAALRADLQAVVDRFEEHQPAVALRACVAWCPLAHDDGSADVTAEQLRRLLGRMAVLPAAALVALGALERKLGHLDAARTRLVAARDCGAPFDALLELAHLDRMQSRLEDALSGYHAALSWSEAHGDAVQRCIALGELGRMHQSLGQNRRAQLRHQEAIALARSLGQAGREALERSLHARATHRTGNVREAIPLHERALAMYRELGQHRLVAAERGHLAFCHHEAGAAGESERLFRASVDGLAEVGDVALECIERTLLARLLGDQERFAEAGLELAIVKTVTRELGMPRVELTRLYVAGLISMGQDDPQGAEAYFAEALALGLHLEIGFEALLPAYLALACSMRGGGPMAEGCAAGPSRFEPGSSEELLARSAARVAQLEAPGLRAALEVLAAATRGQQPPSPPAELVAISSDVRRAQRLVARAGAAPALRITPDGQRVELPDGRAFDFGRRAAPRRLLLALARARREQPGSILGFEALIAAGWPNERMRPDAARQRLRTAIWTLRKLGLEPLLLTRDDGYLLDPTIPLVMR